MAKSMPADRYLVSLDFRLELREIKNERRDGPEIVGLELNELARAWIEDCAVHHRLCQKPSEAELPTRLINVGDWMSNCESIHLVVPEKGSKGRWIMLSYCWGQTNNYRLTSGRLKDLLLRVPFNSLLLTIQDTICITKGLGIRYLWVDALCIIQDSDDDWHAEAGQMMNVYCYAYVTIAANQGKDVTSGMFIDRNPLESRPYEMKIQSLNGKQLVQWCWIHPPYIPWSIRVKTAHLQTRGWTLQETNLSTRIIYYDESGLCWQCQEGIWQERVPAVLITSSDPLVLRRIFDAYAKDPMNIFALWCDLVKDFTSRTLTRETDKLPAISGLASAVATFIQSRCERWLASKEEAEHFSPPIPPRYWAVPENPRAVSTLRYDGGNVSFQDMLIKEELAAGQQIYTHVKGLISMDPFLLKRYIQEIDKEADQALLVDRSPRTRQIMEHVGLGPLLQFEDNTDNPDFDEEFMRLMSHPDTHATYHKAYDIWKANKDGTEIFDPSRDKDTEVPKCRRLDDYKPGKYQSIIHDIDDPPWQNADFGKRVSTHNKGYLIDLNLETYHPIPQRTNMYVYGKRSLIKARIEWLGYVLDDKYLAGLWRADLFEQLQWYSWRPGRRPLKYRAPTWSWTSLDNTKIHFLSNKSAYNNQEGGGTSGPRTVKLLHMDVVPATQNRFGDAVSAKLVLLAGVQEMPFYTDVDVTPFANEHDENWPMTTTKSEPAHALPKTDHQYFRLDEESARLDLSLKVIRVVSDLCLIVEPMMGSAEPQVFKRVGC